MIADSHLILDQNRGKEIQHAYDSTQSITSFENSATDFDTRLYPYTNLRMNEEGLIIDIREGQWSDP